MKHTHMAVGMIPRDLANLCVVVEWTPADDRYAVTLVNHEGQALEGHDYDRKADEPIGYDPEKSELDMFVYRALDLDLSFPARFARGLAGFAYFEWWSPAVMSRKDRAKFGADK
ncbi:hypothetical protein ACFVYF_18910 [Streptomyces sp. NPDC058274]|uniref:hypothetical protein n=1 Tax=Streptomyces sp. NPDC058274 TaxID=3346416 RepID=UPI0036EFE802